MSQFKNQLLPSLFDRLTDEEPRRKKEARSDQVINLDQYRQAVLRDILYLLNTCNMQAETMGIDLTENVRSSTLNYGSLPFLVLIFPILNGKMWTEYQKSHHRF